MKFYYLCKFNVNSKLIILPTFGPDMTNYWNIIVKFISNICHIKIALITNPLGERSKIRNRAPLHKPLWRSIFRRQIIGAPIRSTRRCGGKPGRLILCKSDIFQSWIFPFDSSKESILSQIYDLLSNEFWLKWKEAKKLISSDIVHIHE